MPGDDAVEHGLARAQLAFLDIQLLGSVAVEDVDGAAAIDQHPREADVPLTQAESGSRTMA
jgi:hypothetical protein